ncbi:MULTISPECIES: hypothetical protein [Vibrio]|nr:MULTISPECIES: hypothetical protein [Vibrio]MCS0191291.1 hypothetical protein [Vibrio parahaemolyticus]
MSIALSSTEIGAIRILEVNREQELKADEKKSAKTNRQQPSEAGLLR